MMGRSFIRIITFSSFPENEDCEEKGLALLWIAKEVPKKTLRA